MYHIESEFEYKGYPCKVIFKDCGVRFGYVGIEDKNEPLYGVQPEDELFVSIKDVSKDIGKRSPAAIMDILDNKSGHPSVFLYFDVHGCVTFGGHPKEIASSRKTEDNTWYLGFHCGHFMDEIDYDSIEKYFGETAAANIRKQWEKQNEFDKYLDSTLLELSAKEKTIKDTDYVKNECKRLVDQIIEYNDKVTNKKKTKTKENRNMNVEIKRKTNKDTFDTIEQGTVFYIDEEAETPYIKMMDKGQSFNAVNLKTGEPVKVKDSREIYLFGKFKFVGEL